MAYSADTGAIPLLMTAIKISESVVLLAERDLPKPYDDAIDQGGCHHYEHVRMGPPKKWPGLSTGL